MAGFWLEIWLNSNATPEKLFFWPRNVKWSRVASMTLNQSRPLPTTTGLLSVSALSPHYSPGLPPTLPPTLSHKLNLVTENLSPPTWINPLASNEIRRSLIQISSDQFSSVTQSSPTICDPVNRSTPGLPVHHQLPACLDTAKYPPPDIILLLI